MNVSSYVPKVWPARAICFTLILEFFDLEDDPLQEFLDDGLPFLRVFHTIYNNLNIMNLDTARERPSPPNYYAKISINLITSPIITIMRASGWGG
jgi:hypothetical protein